MVAVDASRTARVDRLGLQSTLEKAERPRGDFDELAYTLRQNDREHACHYFPPR